MVNNMNINPSSNINPHTSTIGNYKGQVYHALSPADKVDYDKRSKNTRSEVSKSFATKSFQKGTSWVARTPFVVLDQSNIVDTQLCTLEPVIKAGNRSNTSKAVKVIPAGTKFTVVDDDFGIEYLPHGFGGLPLSTKTILIDVEGETLLLSPYTAGRHVK